LGTPECPEVQVTGGAANREGMSGPIGGFEGAGAEFPRVRELRPDLEKTIATLMEIGPASLGFRCFSRTTVFGMG